MKILWIVIGILVLMWLGFLTISRNAIELRLNNHEEQMNGYDERYQMRETIEQDTDNKGVIDKVEDKFDKQEDKRDKQIQMPYEKNEPTIKHIRDLDEKEQKKVKEKSNGEANASQSIVAFAYALDLDPVSDTLYNQPTVEAFELKANDSVVAFKLR